MAWQFIWSNPWMKPWMIDWLIDWMNGWRNEMHSSIYPSLQILTSATYQMQSTSHQTSLNAINQCNPSMQSINGQVGFVLSYCTEWLNLNPALSVQQLLPLSLCLSHDLCLVFQALLFLLWLAVPSVKSFDWDVMYRMIYNEFMDSICNTCWWMKNLSN